MNILASLGAGFANEKKISLFQLEESISNKKEEGIFRTP